MTKRGVSDATLPMGSSKVPDRKVGKMPAKMSRVMDVQKNKHLGQSVLKLEDLLDHHGDGFRRRDDGPVISDGGFDEPRDNP